MTVWPRMSGSEFTFYVHEVEKWCRYEVVYTDVFVFCNATFDKLSYLQHFQMMMMTMMMMMMMRLSSSFSSSSTTAELLSVQTINDIVQSVMSSIFCLCLKFAVLVESCVHLKHLVSFTMFPASSVLAVRMLEEFCVFFSAEWHAVVFRICYKLELYFRSVTAPSLFLVNILLCRRWRHSHHVVCAHFSRLETSASEVKF